MMARTGTFVNAISQAVVMLTPDDLRAVDRELLIYLSEGRVTPAYARSRLADEDIGEYSRGYVQQRLARFQEHDHVVNLYDTGLYELQDDPREGIDSNQKNRNT